MDGGGGNTTTVQSSDAPEYAQPYIKYGLGEAQNLYQSSLPSYYPGSTLAARSPETLAGISALASRGMSGSPLTAGAQGLAQQTLAGDFLTAGNPNADRVYQNIESKVLPSVNAQFSLAGRYGSNAHQGNLVDQLTTAYAPTAAGLYENERNRMQDTMFGAPALAQADFQDINAVLQAGGMRDQYGQQQVNADIARHDFAQNIPAQKLAQYMALINGGTVGGTVTSQQPSSSNIGQYLGLGLGALGTAGQLGWI